MGKSKRLNKFVIGGFLLCAFLLACSNRQAESPLYGEWQMIDWNGERPSLDIFYNYSGNGEYTDSRSDDAIWNYKYIEPDSLILYHHGAYEERYKIVALTSDSLIMELSESLFHAEDDGKEVVTEYGNGESQTFKFIRK